jgi:hypothetical protein
LQFFSLTEIYSNRSQTIEPVCLQSVLTGNDSSSRYSYDYLHAQYNIGYFFWVLNPWFSIFHLSLPTASIVLAFLSVTRIFVMNRYFLFSPFYLLLSLQKHLPFGYCMEFHLPKSLLHLHLCLQWF